MPDGNGAWPAPLTLDDAMPAAASATGTAEELLLTFWGPHPAELREA
ncbi:hypothetical protein [Streptomyces sp. NPDC053427]